MAFDWTDYKSLADNLGANTDEASQRSAISRLYYSVFHQARLYLESEGLVFSTMGPGSHQQIWREFRRRGRSHNAVGVAGEHLHKKRIQADYDDLIGNPAALAKDSFTAAEMILTYLKKIQAARNPGQN